MLFKINCLRNKMSCLRIKISRLRVKIRYFLIKINCLLIKICYLRVKINGLKNLLFERKKNLLTLSLFDFYCSNNQNYFCIFIKTLIKKFVYLLKTMVFVKTLGHVLAVQCTVGLFSIRMILKCTFLVICFANLNFLVFNDLILNYWDIICCF